MTIYETIFGIGFLVGGGVLGLYRSALISVVFISGFLAYTSYKAFHTPLGYALMALGISEPTAFFLSLFIVALFPLFTGLVLGMKIIHALRISDYFLDDTYYSSGLSVVDKVFGAGYLFTLFLIVYSLFISE